MSFKSIQSSSDVTACVACLVSVVHAIIWIWSLFLPSHPHIAGWGIGYQIGYCCTSVFSSLPIYSLIIQQRGHCHHYPAVKTAFFCSIMALQEKSEPFKAHRLFQCTICPPFGFKNHKQTYTRLTIHKIYSDFC